MERFNQLNSKHLRFFIAIGALIVVAISLIVFFANNVIAFIDIKNNSGTGDITLSRITDTGSVKVGGGGMTIIPRGSDEFEVAAKDTAKTLTRISLPWYGFTSKSIELKKTKGAKKRAFYAESELCASYNSSRNTLLKYSCAEPTSLIEYQTPDDAIWGDQPVAELSYIENQNLPPYMGGVIGVSVSTDEDSESPNHSGNVSIDAVSPDAKRSYKAPGDIAQDNLAELKVYTDTADATNSRFILVDRFGSIYLATPNDSSTVTYKLVSAPDTYNSAYNQTSCTITGAEATCYRGRNATAIAEGDTAYTQATVDRISFSDGVTSSSKVVDSPKFTRIVKAGESLYGLADQEVHKIEKSGDSYKSTRVLRNVTNVSAGKSLYFIKNSEAFVYNSATGDSHKLFRSPSIKAVAIYAVNDKVFLFGPTKDSEDILFAYELQPEDDNGEKRAIDVLPLETTVLNEVYANDIVGDKVFLQLYGDSIGDDEVRDMFIDEVQKLGIKLDAKNIQTER